VPQGPVQALELAQCGVPVAVRRVPPHEGEVGALVARVAFDHGQRSLQVASFADLDPAVQATRIPGRVPRLR